MLLKIFISILLLGVGVVYAAYLAANRETMTAETFRDGSGYQTATLSHGTTAFRTHGAVGAPAIILVHGATLGSMTYQDYAAPFVAVRKCRIRGTFLLHRHRHLLPPSFPPPPPSPLAPRLGLGLNP